MANYDSASGITGIFDAAAAAGTISAATAAAIASLVEELGNVGAGTVATDITSDAVAGVSAPIVMMAEGQNVNATFDAASDVQAIILSNPEEASHIVFQGDKDITIQLGGANGDSVATGSGQDTITLAGGSATVDTGTGNDIIVLGGDDGVSASIDAGDGFDQVTTTQSRGLFSFLYDAASNVFKMVTKGRAADDVDISMQNVNIVSFDTDGNDAPDQITVLASNEGQAMVARLYQVALGREAIDETGSNANVDGLQFWFEDEANGLGGDASKADLNHVYQSMLACDEFQANIAGKDGTAIVNMLAHNMGNVTTVGEQSLAYYAQQIDGGSMSAEDVAILFAQSSEAASFVGANGMGYVIDGWA